MQIQEKGYAKINLTLDVVSKRPDGYHDLVSIMQSIDLFDTLDFIEIEHGIELTSNCPDLPNDENNLAYKAAKLVQEKTGCTKGVSINLTKRIPIMAGLAGGSTDAAAVLRGVNKVWGLNLSDYQLWQMACELGSDVAFCLKGGTCMAEGRGEILTELELKKPIWILLLKPKISVSTKEVYTTLKCQTITERPNQIAMEEALAKGDEQAIGANLANVLETVTLKMHPELSEYKRFLTQLGAKGVLMSGSGPTIFAIASSREEVENWRNSLKVEMEAIVVTQMLPKEEL